ncbi:hypothetical protein MICAC_3130003 [Microcystis aeruginosa PCC 9443]|uniref:Uncharacterized protein n=1 Tax=Microcystis aeruginosa PCC 9443 TaxID=1160281 RepID=I4G2R4_MICAE|nr:hypothetical protein MICAC_3130003 [Microcystis aeruginosa PCC 9443]
MHYYLIYPERIPRIGFHSQDIFEVDSDGVFPKGEVQPDLVLTSESSRLVPQKENFVPHY